MTFSEYALGLKPFISYGKGEADYFTELIGNFLKDAAMDSCKILKRKPDTKYRYIIGKRFIQPKDAQYLYDQRDISKYTDWIDKRMDDTESYDSIEEWLRQNDIDADFVPSSCAILLESIMLGIINNANSNAETEVKLPPTSDIEGLLEENSALDDYDKELLHDFQADYDTIIKNCISDNYAVIWLPGKISKQIGTLYSEKWEQLSVTFHNLLLRSDVIGALGQLQQLCDILDPNTRENTITAFHPSVRMIRENLRNYYVKLHPDDYVGILPSESFVPQWDDEE